MKNSTVSRQNTSCDPASALGVIKIIIEPKSLKGDRGQRYRVYFQGAALIEASRCPEFDACRLLMARGFVGRLEVWRLNCSYPSMTLHIESAARLTVMDSPSAGPRFVKWIALSDKHPTNAVSRRDGSPGKGRNELYGVTPRGLKRLLAG